MGGTIGISHDVASREHMALTSPESCSTHKFGACISALWCNPVLWLWRMRIYTLKCVIQHWGNLHARAYMTSDFLQRTVYVVIFAVVLFWWISRVSPRENVHFNIWLFIVLRNHHKKCEIKPSRISPPSPKSRRYTCTWNIWCMQYLLFLGLASIHLEGWWYFSSNLLSFPLLVSPVICK